VHSKISVLVLRRSAFSMLLALTLSILIIENAHANDVAKCAVNFNFLARTFEEALGPSDKSEKLRSASKILGEQLSKSYTHETAKRLVEIEIAALKKITNKQDLLKNLESNFKKCLSLVAESSL